MSGITKLIVSEFTEANHSEGKKYENDIAQALSPEAIAKEEGNYCTDEPQGD